MAFPNPSSITLGVQIMSDQKTYKSKYYLIIIPTLLYWFWESRAEGNIRIDLVLLYPILFAIYTGVLWKQHRFYSILFSLGLMILNIILFIWSYELFNKSPG